VIVYHLLAVGTCYEEARYEQWNPKQEARERQRAIKALERLGDTVTVERAASLPGGRHISASSVIGLPCVPKQRQSLSGGGVSTRSRLFRRNPGESVKKWCRASKRSGPLLGFRRNTAAWWSGGSVLPHASMRCWLSLPSISGRID
jgi:hypothetical protein